MVFLHGWGDAGGTFQFVVDALRLDWHVIAPDWRGFGRSKFKACAYWFPDYIADLDCLLARYSPARPARPARLVGHSMGANVAGLYAGVLPDRVSRFVNIEGFGLADTDPARAPERYRSWLEQSRKRSAFRRFESVEALARHVRRRLRASG